MMSSEPPEIGSMIETRWTLFFQAGACSRLRRSGCGQSGLTSRPGLRRRFSGAVLNHPLKFGTVVGLGGVGPVNVGAHDGDIVALGIIFAVPQLAFDGGFALTVGGIAGVDDGGHGGASLRLNMKQQTFV